ncbi:unnamed protein product, partial [Diamesa hyperborea]
KCNCIVDTTSKLIIPTPLFIEPTHKNSFHNPTVKSTDLVFNIGDKVVIACTGAKNAIARLNVQEVEIKCEPSGKFSANGVEYKLDDLKCKIWPESVQRSVGNCGGSFPLVQTAFHVGSNFIPVMESCFDDHTDRTLYTKMTLSKYAGLQKRVDRPIKFDAGHYFNGVNPDTMYYGQKSKFNYLGPIKAKTYFGGSNFFNHGHLAAKSDFQFGAQQRSTFWLTNAPPQWSSFNGGNWNNVESAVREHAANNKKDFLVYTGTHGTLELLFDSGSKKQILMHQGPPSKVPVPQYFWKVVIEPVSKHAVAFIGFNDPYLTAADLSTYLSHMCTDVCHQIKWLPNDLNQANRRNIVKGYIFCCDVNQFRTFVTEFPDKTNYNLLSSTRIRQLKSLKVMKSWKRTQYSMTLFKSSINIKKYISN